MCTSDWAPGSAPTTTRLRCDRAKLGGRWAARPTIFGRLVRRPAVPLNLLGPLPSESICLGATQRPCPVLSAVAVERIHDVSDHGPPVRHKPVGPHHDRRQHGDHPVHHVERLPRPRTEWVVLVPRSLPRCASDRPPREAVAAHPPHHPLAGLRSHHHQHAPIVASERHDRPSTWRQKKAIINAAPR
jgi:hypothetical protein